MALSVIECFLLPAPRAILRAAAIALVAQGCFAAPTGMSVVAGSASQTTSGSTLTINTATPGTILNWQQFSIPGGETVRFNQPGVTSTVLNRVVGGDPSLIYGQLSSNGQVWLVNPAGIVIGPTGRINTAGFLASTLAIADSDAQTSNWNFTGNSASGTIRNEGRITISDGGSVYLIAPQVDNTASGVISAPGGQVMLLAGHRVILTSTAAPGVYYQVGAPDSTATNLGQIFARDTLLQGGMVRNGGLISADSATQDGGRIFLKASKTVTLDAGATLSANGTNGGVVAMEGQTVSVAGSISATGSNGAGGTVILSGTPDIRQSASFDVAGTTAHGSIYTSALANEFDGTAAGWMVSDGWSNGGFFNAVWQAGNAVTSGGELQLSISPCVSNCLSMPYVGGETMSLSRLGYGTYTTNLKAASGDGIVTSLFTYNGSPWDEIDIEILGKDTTKVQFNYFKNGVGGHEQLVDLGFDAAAGYHQYSIKWLAGSISWYVDGVLKHQVSGNNLPSSPGRAMVNLWPAVGVDAWTGAYAGTAATANYQYVRYTPETVSLPSFTASGLTANFTPVPTPPTTPLTLAAASGTAPQPSLTNTLVHSSQHWPEHDINGVRTPPEAPAGTPLTDQRCAREQGIIVCRRSPGQN